MSPTYSIAVHPLLPLRPDEAPDAALAATHSCVVAADGSRFMMPRTALARFSRLYTTLTAATEGETVPLATWNLGVGMGEDAPAASADGNTTTTRGDAFRGVNVALLLGWMATYDRLLNEGIFAYPTCVTYPPCLGPTHYVIETSDNEFFARFFFGGEEAQKNRALLQDAITGDAKARNAINTLEGNEKESILTRPVSDPLPKPLRDTLNDAVAKRLVDILDDEELKPLPIDAKSLRAVYDLYELAEYMDARMPMDLIANFIAVRIREADEEHLEDEAPPAVDVARSWVGLGPATAEDLAAYDVEVKEVLQNSKRGGPLHWQVADAEAQDAQRAADMLPPQP